jgi:hypothetical protein
MQRYVPGNSYWYLYPGTVPAVLITTEQQSQASARGLCHTPASQVSRFPQLVIKTRKAMCPTCYASPGATHKSITALFWNFTFLHDPMIDCLT